MKMYAIFLSALAPEAFLELTTAYRHDLVGQQFLAAIEMVHLGPFVECHLIENSGDTNPWVMQIPIGYILAITNMQEGKHSFGFQSP